jgi:hypothetical protein
VSRNRPLDISIPSRQRFERARHQATLEKLMARLRGQPSTLLPFEEVRERLRLSSQAYQGLRDIPLDRIVGSVGRYQDFTRSFLPVRDSMVDRWARVDDLATREGLGPVELYQVGEAFFVADGHHRISVARQANAPAIEAHVWEYPTRVPLEPEATLESVMIKAEYQEFLERTGLDGSRPEQQILFTAPGQYRELECQIALYQQALGDIDQRPFDLKEAAAYWYDLIYTPVVQIIQQGEVLSAFPGRTEADLFVWTVRHQRELSELFHHPVKMTRAADHLAEQGGGSRLRRALRAIKGRLGR